ncbi:transcription elongation factor B polypeptide 3 [Schistocerca serialis cubense]|uniref:transcription elongation factor B polypeptide 3 n=1 Tax=Schistocerca serialis cubense TaxID=2023355 RepID=UPI00214E3EB2|nr:transcription elongation factor B polypeptide 3 [Schistocerca serialis cubense]
MSVVDVIRHYQRSIEKCQEDEERMLHCINKLCRLPITVQLLKETGVGRTVNALRKYEGQVGEAAKYTVMKWKQMVAEEESSDDDGEEAGDETGTEMHTEEIDETNAIDEEEEEEEEEEDDGDSGGYTVLVKENSRHSHKETHSKSRKDENHKTDSSRHEYKSLKDKTHRDVNSSEKKHKDSHKTQDSNNTRERHSHKRRRDSSKNHRRDEKRKKYDSENENLSDEGSESQEMLIDERVTEAINAERYTDEEQEEEEGDGDNDDDDESNDVSDRDSTLLAPEHGSHSKQHSSSSSSSHHHKHHKESHRKHDKHKEKKVHSSDKHSRKSDSDKVNERTGASDSKEKHSKHKDHKHEHKNNKHKLSNNTGELRKEKSENVKQKTDSVLKDSNSSKTDSKKKTKEKTDSASKTNTSHKHHKSSDSKPKEVKEKKIKKSEHVNDEDDDVGGISSMSGASFAEALGMVDPMIKKKSTNSSGSSSNSKTARSSSSKTSAVVEKSSSKSKEMKPPKVIPSAKDEPVPLLSSSVKLEPLKVDLDATLPEISPNYRPLPHPTLDAMPHKKIKALSEEEELAQLMSQKNQRTKVYSGLKSGKSWTKVPTLFDICVRVLQENIEAIEYTGGVPYDLLKPVLIIATPDQLFMLEHYNPYLIEETDELWEFHCKKSFRTKEREEMETWREMYMRCVEEQEAKLKALTSNIQQSIAKSTPIRQTKLAYVDSIAKPPRNVAKQQAKYGTAGPVVISKGSPVKGAKTGMGRQNSGPSTSAAPVPVPPPRSVQSAAKVKPRMAPLMQKTMKLVKSFKR